MIELPEIEFRGRGLLRPECVLATRSGVLFVSNWAGGVTRIGADGGQTEFLHGGTRDLKQNGIALRRDGSFLVAHLGGEATDGGVYHLMRDGGLADFVCEVDGRPLPPTNYVTEDSAGRTWITVSTRLIPRDRAYNRDVADGFIVLRDKRGTRIVADGLGFTNEVALDAGGEHLYVNETFARRLSRFRITDGGDLKDRETVAEFGVGTFPDGMAIDAEGAVWIVSIVSNRVVRILPGGRQETILEDSDVAHLAWVEAAYAAGEVGRPHLDKIESQRLGNVSSVAFGGADLRTVYLGCLLGEAVAFFRSPVPGRAPVHWEYDA